MDYIANGNAIEKIYFMHPIACLNFVLNKMFHVTLQYKNKQRNIMLNRDNKSRYK